jgi:predicted AAA+ superfamily ATPase
MKYIARQLEKPLLAASRRFPACILTGPRRAGKTFLLRHLFPNASYHLLEAPDLIDRIRSDPRGFLDEIELPAILDEIQNIPELVPYIRERIDREPNKFGRWLLTGSQEAPLMRHLNESLAGRAAVFQLPPFSIREFSRWNLLLGGYPEAVAHPKTAPLWFSSYLQTYLERDIRSMTSIRQLPTFRRFLSLLAARHGQMLNKTDLAGPLAVSVPTITEWLNLLEATFQILLVPPYFENFSKRLVKSPKIYWSDPGMACHLLGIESQKMLEKSPFLGGIFEGFIASEIVKSQIGAGKRRELYYFRDSMGLEVDFLVPGVDGELLLLEAKASRTLDSGMAKPLQQLAASIKNRPVRSIIVHRKPKSGETLRTLSPGVESYSVEEFFGRDMDL